MAGEFGGRVPPIRLAGSGDVERVVDGHCGVEREVCCYISGSDVEEGFVEGRVYRSARGGICGGCRIEVDLNAVYRNGHCRRELVGKGVLKGKGVQGAVEFGGIDAAENYTAAGVVWILFDVFVQHWISPHTE